MDQPRFEQMYQGQAPWDIGRPQSAIIKLAEAGQIRGSVLDVGCGTGDNVLYLCFSDEEPGTHGPRRITQQEIGDSFHDGWKVERIEPTRFESIERPDGPRMSPGGPKAWLATIERT